MDNVSVFGEPSPLPSQLAPDSHGDPVPVVPVAGVNVHDQPLSEPDVELQLEAVEGQT